MRRPRPATLALLGFIVVWVGVVVVHTAQASGEWLVVIRESATLLALAGLLGFFAATVDNLVDDLRFGDRGGKGGGGPMALRAHITKPSATNRRRRGDRPR